MRDWLPAWVFVAGTAAVAAGLLLCGTAGIVWALGIGASRESLFYKLNVVAYTPLCLVLGPAAAIQLWP